LGPKQVKLAVKWWPVERRNKSQRIESAARRRFCEKF
jgi:hypothetical protein